MIPKTTATLMVGLKWLFPLFGIIMVAFFVVNLVVVWQFFKAYEPLGSYPVQEVISRVPGVEGPAAYFGESVLIKGTRCVDFKTGVLVQSRAYWSSRDTRAPIIRQPVANSGVFATRETGCTTRQFVNAIEPPLEPGIWRYEGFDTTIGGPKVQVKAYWSQDFQVVEKPVNPQNEAG